MGFLDYSYVFTSPIYRPSEPELEQIVPVFTKQLSGPTDILKEAQSVHMDCMVQPINDPNLKVFETSLLIYIQ